MPRGAFNFQPKVSAEKSSKLAKLGAFGISVATVATGGLQVE
jgi:hypothetical protein